MNAPKRLKVRQPLNASTDFDITQIIPLFHRWIQLGAVPGLLIDVADYKHVPNGPGIFLIGDEGDYSLEEADGRFHFVYDRKRQTGDDLSESVRIVLHNLQAALQALAAESSLGLFAADNPVELTLLDRLQYPNSIDTFDTIRGSLAEAVTAAYEQPQVQLNYSSTDSRRPLTTKIVREPIAVAA